jgi:hypothetical protein
MRWGVPVILGLHPVWHRLATGTRTTNDRNLGRIVRLRLFGSALQPCRVDLDTSTDSCIYHPKRPAISRSTPHIRPQHLRASRRLAYLFTIRLRKCGDLGNPLHFLPSPLSMKPRVRSSHRPKERTALAPDALPDRHALGPIMAWLPLRSYTTRHNHVSRVRESRLRRGLCGISPPRVAASRQGSAISGVCPHRSLARQRQRESRSPMCVGRSYHQTASPPGCQASSHRHPPFPACCSKGSRSLHNPGTPPLTLCR